MDSSIPRDGILDGMKRLSKEAEYQHSFISLCFSNADAMRQLFQIPASRGYHLPSMVVGCTPELKVR